MLLDGGVYAARVLARVRAALSLVLAVSCAPASSRVATIEVPPAAPAPSAAEEPRAPREPEIDYLADGAAERVAKHAWIVREGPARLLVNGTIAGGSEGRPSRSHPTELPVVAERADAVRVLAEGWGARLLIWIGREDLGLVPLGDAVLATAPDAPADAARGVRVAAGLLLEEKARREGLRKVGAQTKSLSFEGWLPERALGAVFERRPFEAASPAAGARGAAREGAAILESPGGAEIARFHAYTAGGRAFAFEVEAEPGAPAGWQRVRFVDTAWLASKEPAVEVRGLVIAADVQLKAPSIGRLGGSHRTKPPMVRGLPRGTLARGAALFAEDRRTRVGVAIEDVLVHLGGALEDGYREVQVSVPAFSLVKVWVRAETVTPGEAE